MVYKLGQFRRFPGGFSTRLLFICLLFLPDSALYAADTYQISNSIKSLDLAVHAKFFEDKGKSLTIKNILTPEFINQFQKNTSSSLSFGHSTSAYWIKIDLESKLKLPQEFLFEINSTITQVDIHILNKNGLTSESAGLNQAFENRSFKHRSFIFPITLRPDHPTRVFFRVQSLGPITVPIKLWTNRAFSEKDRIDQLFWGAFSGILLTMILYNIYLFLTLKEKANLYYVLFCLGILGYFAVFSGSLQEIFSSYSFTWYAKWLNLVGIFTGASLLLFSIEYLLLTFRG